MSTGDAEQFDVGTERAESAQADVAREEIDIDRDGGPRR